MNAEIFNVQGKTAVITGAGGVICGTMAREMAKAGMNVALLNRTLEKAQRIAQEITDGGGEAIAVQADVLDKETLETAREQVTERFGRVDVLVNGAGGNRKDASTSSEMSFFDIPFSALQDVFDLNVLGAILTTQIFGRDIVASNGSVINIASMASRSEEHTSELQSPY